jgi:hypothetical protein
LRTLYERKYPSYVTPNIPQLLLHFCMVPYENWHERNLLSTRWRKVPHI